MIESDFRVFMAIRSKEQIRAEILLARSMLEKKERQKKSKAICNRLWTELTTNVPNARHILFFAPLPTEVDLYDLMRKMLKKGGHHIYFPKITDMEGGIFEIFEIEDADDLQPNFEHFHLDEPVGMTPADPQIVDVALVPAVAVDGSGFRIGFGRGFYDRFLPRLRSDAEKWATIFYFQTVDEIPRQEHDFPVQAICTEFGFFHCA